MGTWSAELSRFCGRERARTAYDAVNSSAGNRALRSRWIQRRLRPHQLEFPLRRRFLERPHQLPDRGKRCVAFLSRRLLQGTLLGPGSRLLRKFLCRKRPRRRGQLVSVHCADIGLPSTVRCKFEDFLCATPGEREAGPTVAVVMNDGAAVAQVIALEANA